MKKILIVSTVSRQFYLFEKGNIETLKSLGFEVHAAASFNDENERLKEIEIVKHPINIERSPLSLKNITAYKQLKKIMITGNFDAVHCHSPMGGVLARIAARNVGISNVIYTAHGFHFYKGAPIKNWLFYYPVELLLSKFTDFIITINKEDYAIAKKFFSKTVDYVPGIGVDIKKFEPTTVDNQLKRKEWGISEDTVVLLSIGEMIERKNYKTSLNAIAKMKYENYIYLICGAGPLEDELKNLAKSLGISDKVKFLGFRNDIVEICKASDIFVFPSYQEGLPVSVMESMAAGLPIVCSAVRGNNDLVEEGIGGFLALPDNVLEFTKNIEKLLENKELRIEMGKYNKSRVKDFGEGKVQKKMREIYRSIT